MSFISLYSTIVLTWACWSTHSYVETIHVYITATAVLPLDRMGHNTGTHRDQVKNTRLPLQKEAWAPWSYPDLIPGGLEPSRLNLWTRRSIWLATGNCACGSLSIVCLWPQTIASWLVGCVFYLVSEYTRFWLLSYYIRSIMPLELHRNVGRVSRTNLFKVFHGWCNISSHVGSLDNSAEPLTWDRQLSLQSWVWATHRWCVCVIHIKPFFLLVDFQHTQSVSALILRPREIQHMWSQNYYTGSYVINITMPCHNIHTSATYPDTLFSFFFFFISHVLSSPFCSLSLLYSRNSDLGSHSRLLSPLTHHGSCLAFFYRKISALCSLVDLLRH